MSTYSPSEGYPPFVAPEPIVEGTQEARFLRHRCRFIGSEYGLEIANQMRAHSRKNQTKDYNLLKSIPGIGGYLASVILAECGDLRRFNNESQFSSFVGLVPGIYNSGGTEKCLGITPRSRSQLRSYRTGCGYPAPD